MAKIPQLLNVEDLREWQMNTKTQYAYDYTDNKDKQLEIGLDGCFYVWNKKELIYKGYKVRTAINEYNKL